MIILRLDDRICIIKIQSISFKISFEVIIEYVISNSISCNTLNYFLSMWLIYIVLRYKTTTVLHLQYNDCSADIWKNANNFEYCWMKKELTVLSTV